MAESKVSIISKAAIKLGESPVSGDDGSSAWEIGDSVYNDCYESLLAYREWTFARNKQYFAKLSKDSVADYKYVYQIPNNVLTVIDLNELTTYEIIQGELHTDIDNPLVSCIIKPDESKLPAPFVKALVMVVAAEMCYPLTDNSTREEKLTRQSVGLIRQAVAMDLSQEPLSSFNSNTITAVR
ncbi:MAG: hypothetical protein WBG43_13055 [Marinifilaceae bacterium]